MPYLLTCSVVNGSLTQYTRGERIRLSPCPNFRSSLVYRSIEPYKANDRSGQANKKSYERLIGRPFRRGDHLLRNELFSALGGGRNF